MKSCYDEDLLAEDPNAVIGVHVKGGKFGHRPREHAV